MNDYLIVNVALRENYYTLSSAICVMFYFFCTISDNAVTSNETIHPVTSNETMDHP